MYFARSGSPGSRRPLHSRLPRLGCESARRQLIAKIPGVLIEPTVEQILAYCAEDPIERVFLEDVARRGFAASARGGAGVSRRSATSAPTSSRRLRLRGVRGQAAARGTRMIIGQEQSVTDLWGATSRSCPNHARTGRANPSMSSTSLYGPGLEGVAGGDLDDLDLLLPACAATHHEELGIDPLERDAAGFRRRTVMQIEEGRRGSGPRTGRFSSRRRHRPGRRKPFSSSRSGSTLRCAGRETEGAGSATSAGSLGRTPTVTLFVRPENEAAIRL